MFTRTELNSFPPLHVGADGIVTPQHKRALWTYANLSERKGGLEAPALLPVALRVGKLDMAGQAEAGWL